MGIDTRVFVRNRGPHLDAASVHRLADRLKADLPEAAKWLGIPDLAESEVTLVRTLGEMRAEWAFWEQDPAIYGDDSEYREDKVHTAGLPDYLHV